MIHKCIRMIWPIQFPGKSRLLNSLVPKEGVLEQSVFGRTMQLDISDYIQRSIYLGCFESSDTKLLKNYIQPGMCVFDVGANVGYYSLLASDLVGSSGKVYSFEPTQELYSALEKVVKDNNIVNVYPQKYGLDSRSHKSVIYKTPEHMHNNTPSMFDTGEGTPSDIELITLDDFAAENDIAQIDLMKIDIEGMELRALEGATELLKTQRIKSILIEFNDFWLTEAGTSAKELYDFIVGYGFHSGLAPVFSKGATQNHFFRLKE